MSDPYIGEIRLFAGNFAPQGWSSCEGQLLPISQYDALFSLFGTTYGGDGQTTFGLPDLRGRVPVHAGSGPGLSPRSLGENGGAEAVTLGAPQVQAHGHGLTGSTAAASADAGPAGVLATASVAAYGTDLPGAAMAAAAVAPAGQAPGAVQGHDNMAPSLALNYIVALYGVYPSRQ